MRDHPCARRRPLLAILLAWLALFPAVAAATDAPDFTLRGIDGRSHSLSDHEGKVVLVAFWATCCGGCATQLVAMQKLQDELADDGLAVVAISSDDARSVSQVKPFVRRLELTMPVLLDTDTSVTAQYNPGKVRPFTVLVGRDREILEVWIGFTPEQETPLRTAIAKALAQTVTASP